MMLGEFLQRECASSAPWNCSTMPADWCVTLGHPDFAAAWRDTINPAACDAAQDVTGGLLALWDAGISGALFSFTPMTDAGLYAHDLAPGDILVASLAGFDAGGIWTGQRVAIRATRGVHFIAPEMLTIRKAWRP